MNLNDLHRRLLQDVVEIGNALPLVLAGGYAVQAHRIVNRFSRDIDMATDSAVKMETIVNTVIEGLTGRGWRIEVIGVDPHGARMMATDPRSAVLGAGLVGRHQPTAVCRILCRRGG